MNDVFRALSDPTRREIVRLLRSGPRSAGEIARHFPLAKSTLSAHFKELRHAGLIEAERDGTTIYYRLNASVLQQRGAVVASWLDAGSARGVQLAGWLQQPDVRPQAETAPAAPAPITDVASRPAAARRDDRATRTQFVRAGLLFLTARAAGLANPAGSGATTPEPATHAPQAYSHTLAPGAATSPAPAGVAAYGVKRSRRFLPFAV